ncbi:hypothetical protein C2845_PM06G01650 [Panicum miliaceum]|uniref:Isopenicillin N synthase-like Fe(2+) 2OG dioxygenase domain-containing protein n=1 Tax=Panicum miliaceum TaxID=4540 RepID=A0A3L6REH0_PANMI|nr:hypothetical protein C2845_PM06G01650 [Panicum miliaceum]
MQQQRPPSVRAVTIPFAELEDKGKDLSGKIGGGFGRQGSASSPSPTVANLPEEVKRGLEDPNSRFPSYCRPNIWPTGDLPELETAFKDLGKLMLEVGLMLAHHCDHYGLTCGLFVRKSVEIPCPDSGAGLHIRSRDNQVVKVTFEDDELAYMTGETAEILSRGHLRATPHCVKAPSSEDASLVDRSTFALFVQPNWDEKIKFPSGFPYHQELSIPPNETLSYGEYSERILNKHYEEART